jgi:hypothetical protein
MTTKAIAKRPKYRKPMLDAEPEKANMSAPDSLIELNQLVFRIERLMEG